MPDPAMAGKIKSDLHGDMQLTQMSVIPCRVSSGPHEWYNNLATVLTRDSVKLQVA